MAERRRGLHHHSGRTSAFLHLSTNEEREQFIEAFWQRRNPDPDSAENTYKEEHYRRIAYANEHFCFRNSWLEDRPRQNLHHVGSRRMRCESHPAGGNYDRPPDQGGGETSTYPFEDWRYRYLEGIGENVEIEFVDPTMTGEYHADHGPQRKGRAAVRSGRRAHRWKPMGLASKTARFNNTDGTHDGSADRRDALPETMRNFRGWNCTPKIQQPPPVKFKDLEAVVTSRLVRDQVKFDYRIDFLRITSDTVLVPITIQIPTRQLSFQEKNGVESASVNLFCARDQPERPHRATPSKTRVRRDVPAALAATIAGHVRRFIRRRCRSVRDCTAWTSC